MLAARVAALRNAGLFVVCYGDGVLRWPLGRRCQLLLAGALDILDSARAEFADELAVAGPNLTLVITALE